MIFHTRTGVHSRTIFDTFDNVYINPVTHSGCYFLGILCAYICFHHGDRLKWVSDQKTFLLIRSQKMMIILINSTCILFIVNSFLILLVAFAVHESTLLGGCAYLLFLRDLHHCSMVSLWNARTRWQGDVRRLP